MDEPISPQYNKPAPSSTEAKDPQPIVTKITTGKVTIQRKSRGKKFMETFFGATAKSVGAFVVLEVIIPAIKDMLVEAGQQGLERAFYGDARPGMRRFGRPGSHTPYNRYAATAAATSAPSYRRGEPARQMTIDDRARHDFSGILVASRIEAHEILAKMGDFLERYEKVTVANLYDLVGVTPHHPDNKWGWKTLDGADVYRARDGQWGLSLPPTELLT